MPHLTSPPPPLQRAAISLKIAVVGGGLGGLASAYALTLAGHEVVGVVERTEGNYKSRGGLQSTPGMTRVLLRWGLAGELKEHARKCGLLVFRNGLSNAMIGSLKMDQDFLGDLMSEFLFIQHQSLCDILFERLRAAGVPILFNTTLTSVETGSEGATLALSSGQSLTSDLVIAADGWHSTLRDMVAHGVSENLEVATELQIGPPPPPPEEKLLQLTFTLPAALLTQDADLSFLTGRTLWPMWMGYKYAIHMNMTTDGKELTASMTYDWDRALRSEDREWAQRPLEYFELDMDRFCTPLRKLFDLVTTVSARVVAAQPVAEDFVCADSSIILTGDAAHPLLPARPALAIEDAETLRAILARLEDRAQLPHFLTAYEELRQPYCAGVVAYDRGFHQLVRAAPGSEMDARDAVLRETMAHGDWEHMDEAMFRAVWETELKMYLHDPTEQVESHWSHWGRFMSSAAVGTAKKGKRASVSRMVLTGLCRFFTKLPDANS